MAPLDRKADGFCATACSQCWGVTPYTIPVNLAKGRSRCLPSHSLPDRGRPPRSETLTSDPHRQYRYIDPSAYPGTCWTVPSPPSTTLPWPWSVTPCPTVPYANTSQTSNFSALSNFSPNPGDCEGQLTPLHGRLCLRPRRQPGRVALFDREADGLCATACLQAVLGRGRVPISANVTKGRSLIASLTTIELISTIY